MSDEQPEGRKWSTGVAYKDGDVCLVSTTTNERRWWWQFWRSKSKRVQWRGTIRVP